MPRVLATPSPAERVEYLLRQMEQAEDALELLDGLLAAGATVSIDDLEEVRTHLAKARIVALGDR